MIEFNDRRPDPSTNLRLTRRQRELVHNFDIGEPDEQGRLTLTKDGYRKALESAHEMLDEAPEWGGREYEGVRRSAKNLTRKLNTAVRGAIKDKCPDCGDHGCRNCLNTGRRLR